MANFLTHLALLMADISTKEQLVEDLEKHIKTYKENPDAEKAFEALAMQASLLMNKVAIERDGGLENVMKNVESVQKAKSAFDMHKQTS